MRRRSERRLAATVTSEVRTSSADGLIPSALLVVFSDQPRRSRPVVIAQPRAGPVRAGPAQLQTSRARSPVVAGRPVDLARPVAGRRRRSTSHRCEVLRPVSRAEVVRITRALTGRSAGRPTALGTLYSAGTAGQPVRAGPVVAGRPVAGRPVAGRPRDLARPVVRSPIRLWPGDPPVSRSPVCGRCTAFSGAPTTSPHRLPVAAGLGAQNASQRPIRRFRWSAGRRCDLARPDDRSSALVSAGRAPDLTRPGAIAAWPSVNESFDLGRSAPRPSGLRTGVLGQGWPRAGQRPRRTLDRGYSGDNPVASWPRAGSSTVRARGIPRGPGVHRRAGGATATSATGRPTSARYEHVGGSALFGSGGSPYHG